ncbi:glycosyltransferase [Aestuariivivens marinum]|uniref:glycosyltransferase n=1 Tax=Aestuariivivens marinum TaxID=2913555 RepID=UPI001F5ADB33|nr:glycosyltransferase [Aestuariivivens marinum]
MISICVPIYNFDVTNLLVELNLQSKRLDVPSEIILIDDCSNPYFKSLNDKECSKHTYIKLKNNLGRAVIRNKFLEFTKYEYLLFLDCDSFIPRLDFLEIYVKSIKLSNVSVICGGRIYPKEKPARNKILRWKYGVYKESKPYDVRSKYPNRSFMTNNFVVSKNVFEIVQFDERIYAYGHEDTLFGFQLKKAGIMVSHIYNPVLNGDLENNLDYILSVEKSILNLVNILKFINYDKEFIDDVKLLRFYYKYYKYKDVFAFLFDVLKPVMRYAFSKGYVNLTLFDFYKLGFLSININVKD